MTRTVEARPRRRPFGHRLALGLIAAALLPACGLLRPPSTAPTLFYVLTVEERPAAGDTVAVGASKLVLGLGPIVLPPYLERPQMARRTGPNEVAYSETDRWAEPLQDNFARVLAGNLDELLGTERIVFYPWYRNTPMTYAVSVAVGRFERQAGDQVELQARWNVTDTKGGVLASRESRLSRTAVTTAESIEALSALVAELAEEIAAVVRELHGRGA